MFRAELEQFHERVEQSFERPRNPPTGCRRERLPRRGARVEEEENDGGDFEDENGYDSFVSNRRYGDIEKIGIGKIIICETLR